MFVILSLSKLKWSLLVTELFRKNEVGIEKKKKEKEKTGVYGHVGTFGYRLVAHKGRVRFVHTCTKGRSATEGSLRYSVGGSLVL